MPLVLMYRCGHGIDALHAQVSTCATTHVYAMCPRVIQQPGAALAASPMLPLVEQHHMQHVLVLDIYIAEDREKECKSGQVSVQSSRRSRL